MSTTLLIWISPCSQASDVKGTEKEKGGIGSDGKWYVGRSCSELMDGIFSTMFILGQIGCGF